MDKKIIIIASNWTVGQDQLAAITWLNKLAYANRHRYHAAWSHHRPGIDIMWDRPLKWAKLLDQIPDGSWVLFIGNDAIITRPDLPLENWIDDAFDACLLVDHFCVFGDVHLWKANSKTRKFMRDIASGTHEIAKKWGNEQERMAVSLSNLDLPDYQAKAKEGGAYGSEEYYRKAEALLNATEVKVKVINNRKFTGDDPRHWPPGDIPPWHCWTREHFILHLGGMNMERRLRALPEYLFYSEYF